MSDSEIVEKMSGLKPRWDSVSGWKRKLLYLAAAVGLIGLGTDNYQLITGENESTAKPVETRSSSSSMATGLVEGNRGGNSESSPSQKEGGIEKWLPEFTWGGATTRLGLSFAIGFMIALAIRWFIKTALTIAALVAGGAALLVHYGVIEPFWGEDFELVKDLGHWLAAQTETVTTLVKSYLPSGAASAVGIFLGLRK